MYISIATIKNHIYCCKYQNYSLLNNSKHNYSVKTHQTLSHIFINFAPQNPFDISIIYDSCILWFKCKYLLQLLKTIYTVANIRITVYSIIVCITIV